MRPTVLKFGFASAGVTIGFMLATLPFIDRLRTDVSDVLGYTSIVMAAVLIFFGIRSYRERSGGAVSFGRAMAVGVLISLVSSLCYVLAFQVVYFYGMPQFGDRFTQCMVLRAEEAGKSQEELDEVARQAATLRELYDHPVTNAGLTLATNFSIGLAAAVVSAAILRRRRTAEIDEEIDEEDRP